MRWASICRCVAAAAASGGGDAEAILAYDVVDNTWFSVQQLHRYVAGHHNIPTQGLHESRTGRPARPSPSKIIRKVIFTNSATKTVIKKRNGAAGFQKYNQ